MCAAADLAIVQQTGVSTRPDATAKFAAFEALPAPGIDQRQFQVDLLA